MKLHVCLPPSRLSKSLCSIYVILFVDPYHVSWLLEAYPEDVPADLMAGVSDPLQPFDDQTSTNDISDFIMDSSDFDFPEWYEDKQVQEVTLHGDPDNKDSTSLSILSDVVE